MLPRAVTEPGGLVLRAGMAWEEPRDLSPASTSHHPRTATCSYSASGQSNPINCSWECT